jgi:hypothetical protein
MAVIQISKIQIRRGLATAEGLPRLASGEMGWAIDEQRLFIGNGSVAEGAPAVGNTEVLTEARLFDLLSTENFTSATNYTYMGHYTDTSIMTGPDSNIPVVRSLQEVLDDNVTVLNFGAEERTDITSALQRAIFEIYNNTDKDIPRSRLPLRIPAGEYYISDAVQIPPYVTLVGDGIDKTVLIATGTNTTIFETVDSDRNTSPNIESDKQPRHIDISGMTIRYGTETSITTSTPLLLLNGIADSRFTNVKFAGNYNSSEESTTTYTAVLLGGVITRDVHFHDCEFADLCYPAIANDDMEYISFENNRFSGLFQGLTFANDLQGSSPSQYGPRNVDIKNNKFIDIERQAIYAGPNTRDNNQINSESNSFENVGNDLLGDDNPLYPVVSMLSHGNSTVNDDFQRLWNAQKTYAAISQKPIIEGTIKVVVNSTDRRVINESTQTETLIRIPYANTVTSITVDYTLEKTSVIRKGSLSVVGHGSATSVRDTYNVAGLSDGDTIFSAELVDTETLGSIDTLAVQYENPVSSGTGTIVFNVSYYK